MPDAPQAEAIIDPALPIVDPHHHLWFYPPAVLDMLGRRGNLTAQALLPAFRVMPATCSTSCLPTSIRAQRPRDSLRGGRLHVPPNRPQELRSMGEVEFAERHGRHGRERRASPTSPCAPASSGSVDLRVGDAAAVMLEAHLQAGGGRYRGIRASHVVHDPHPAVLGPRSTAFARCC